MHTYTHVYTGATARCTEAGKGKRTTLGKGPRGLRHRCPPQLVGSTAPALWAQTARLHGRERGRAAGKWLRGWCTCSLKQCMGVAVMRGSIPTHHTQCLQWMVELCGTLGS